MSKASLCLLTLVPEGIWNLLSILLTNITSALMVSCPGAIDTYILILFYLTIEPLNNAADTIFTLSAKNVALRDYFHKLQQKGKVIVY